MNEEWIKWFSENPAAPPAPESLPAWLPEMVWDTFSGAFR
jgi:hypothetical protein